MAVWQTILITLTGNALLVAILGWLAKSFVSGLLAKDLETHKALLKAETDETIEKLRHQLQITATEHQVRFSRLHETRANVIAELYKLLVEMHWATISFVSPMESAEEPAKKEKYSKLIKAFQKFYIFFGKKKIYLPEELCEQLNSIVQEMSDKTSRFGVYVLHTGDFDPLKVQKEKLEEWHKAWKYFDKKFPTAKLALENELRKILG